MENKYLKTGKMTFFVVISAILQCIALSSFTVPGKLYPAGVSGISRLLSDVLLDYFSINIPYNIFYLIINIFFAIIVFKYIGKMFTIFSLIQTILVSLLVPYFKAFINVDDVLLLAVFGGIINGIGTGFALQNGASTGGTDFISIYFSNKYKKSMWSYIFILNSAIVVTAGLIYGWQRALYSIIYQYVSTTVVKSMHNRYTFEALNIITKKPAEVEQEIIANTRHGITEMRAIGGFKKEETTMLYMVVNGFQVDEVIESVLRADPKAFISISDVKSVVGNYYQKPLD